MNTTADSDTALRGPVGDEERLRSTLALREDRIITLQTEVVELRTALQSQKTIITDLRERLDETQRARAAKDDVIVAAAVFGTPAIAGLIGGYLAGRARRG